MSERRRLIGSVATVTIALGILLGVRPVSIERLVAGYVITLAAVVLISLVRDFREHTTPEEADRFEDALRGRTRKRAGRQPAFIAMEREIEQGMEHAVQAHRRLLPLLRTAAAARLAVKHGVEIEHRPDVARRMLGDEAWEYLRPDRPEPVDRQGPGLPRDTIAALIERVEAL
jgi:hypothetical protein